MDPPGPGTAINARQLISGNEKRVEIFIRIRQTFGSFNPGLIDRVKLENGIEGDFGAVRKSVSSAQLPIFKGARMILKIAFLSSFRRSLVKATTF